jgi:hypothetical protein
MSRFSPAAFLIGFCCTYALVFAENWPLFLYYPLHANFNWGPQVQKGIGPAMAWYGLMANAGIVGCLAAVAVPSRVLDTLFRGYLWLFPAGTMLLTIFLLRHFFI